MCLPFYISVSIARDKRVIVVALELTIGSVKVIDCDCWNCLVTGSNYGCIITYLLKSDATDTNSRETPCHCLLDIRRANTFTYRLPVSVRYRFEILSSLLFKRVLEV